MLIIGVCGISYEYTFSKMASDILGDSVKQWSVIIGLMMLFMGVGADLQKYLPDRYLVDGFIGFEILLGLLGATGPTIILWAFGAFHDHFILIHYFFICSVGFLIGLEIPLLTRVNHFMAPSLKRNLGMILKMDYIGSFLGALVWVFFLPKFLNLLEIGYFLGILNLMVALVAWVWLRDSMWFPKRIVLFCLLSLFILILGLISGEKITLSLEQKLYRDPIIFQKTTPYQHIVVTKKRSGEIYFYINGHLQFSGYDEHIYHEMLVHPVMSAAGKRENILVLGGGDGLAVREILRYPDVKNITLVDLDPAVTDLAKSLPELVRLNQKSLLDPRVDLVEAKGVTPGEEIGLLERGRGFFRRQKTTRQTKVHVINLDAYTFLDNVAGIYDVIILDFPDPNHIALSKLYSLEFYSLIKDRLAVDGLLIQQSSSPVFAKEVFLMIGRTMKAAGLSVLPLHHNVPSFGDWGWWIGSHRERFSEAGLKKLISGLSGLPEEVRYITPELIKSSLVFGKDFMPGRNQEINRILDDRIFQIYINAWKHAQ